MVDARKFQHLSPCFRLLTRAREVLPPVSRHFPREGREHTPDARFSCFQDASSHIEVLSFSFCQLRPHGGSDMPLLSYM